MAAFNKVILMGNLTRDPELSYAQTGTAICKFGMAMNRKSKDREEVCFVDLVAWGKQAELLNQHVTKGSAVLIEGRLSYSSWEDKNDGKRRSKHEVIVEQFQFMPKARSDGGGDPGASETDTPF